MFVTVAVAQMIATISSDACIDSAIIASVPVHINPTTETGFLCDFRPEALTGMAEVLGVVASVIAITLF